jgi:hypothetical protein
MGAVTHLWPRDSDLFGTTWYYLYILCARDWKSMLHAYLPYLGTLHPALVLSPTLAGHAAPFGQISTKLP